MDANWNSWLNLRNPAVLIMKKYLADILKERFPKHVEIIERIGLAMQTDKDIDSLGKLVADLYEVGYYKAVNDYQAQLANLGYNIKIGPPPAENKESKIFK